MSLGFILGRAGAGKTTLCLRCALEAAASGPEGPPVVLLVPEQATLGMEQALLEMATASALARVRVSGFRRLALGVLEEVGGPVRPVTRLGCLMALVGILERRRSQLTVLAPVAGQVGAAARVEAALAELRAWGIGARELADLAGALGGEKPPRLARKLHDLALLAGDLEEWLAGRVLEPEGVLAAARDRLVESGLRGAAVWVDGFSDFTRPELEFLLALAAVAKVRVALCLDPERAGGGSAAEAGPFAEVAVTLEELMGRARRLGLQVEETVTLAGCPPARFRSSPALARLEAGLAAGEAPAADLSPRRGNPAGVRLVVAPDRRAEVEWAAREILRLVREEGLRFRDVGVLARTVEPYADLVETVFPAFGVPFFLDRRRPARHHPLVRLLLSALEAVADWSPKAVLAYLKNDLQPAHPDAVDRIEAEARRRWLEGERDWLGEWSGVPRRWERTRLRLLRPLVRFRRRVAGREGLPAARVGEAVWRLLEELRLPVRLARRAEAAAREGRAGEAADDLQAWEGVIRVLEEYVEHLGDTVLSLEQHGRVLEAALFGLDLATPPPALDQVVVGAVDRSRFHGLEALLVLGVAAGEFPAVPQEDAVLDDAERERLSDLGFPVGPTTRRLQCREEYLAYVALTRPARHLWLSRPLVDGEGRALAPSPLVRQVRACLGPDDDAEEFPGRVPAPAECASGPDVLDALLAALREAAGAGKPPPAWRSLYEVVRRRPSLAAVLQTALAEVGPAGSGPWPAPPLPARRVAAVSVTELEDMAACPFRRFLRHVVKALPPREARVDGRFLGELYHHALAALGRVACERPGGFADLADAETEALLDAALSRILADGGGTGGGESPGGREGAGGGEGAGGLPPALRRLVAARARRSLLSAAEVLRAWAARSAFRPLAVELEVRFPLPGGEDVWVTGRLDRLDRALVEGENLLLVVDYKRRAASPGGLPAVREGRHLQLPLYCLAASYRAAFPAAGAAALSAGAAGAVAVDAGAVDAGAGGAGMPGVGVAGALLFPVEPARAAGAGAGGRARHRARGWLLGERRILLALDAEAGGERSALGVRWRRDGEPVASDHLLDRAAFAALQAEAVAVSRVLVEAMAAGEVRRRPWRRGAETACDRCRYAPLCPFDPLLGDEYRLLAGAPHRPTDLGGDGVPAAGGGDS